MSTVTVQEGRSAREKDVRSRGQSNAMSTSLAQNSVISGLAAIATNLAGFLSTVIVARLVGVAGTGVVSFAATVATITIAVFDLGIQTALTRFVPEVEATGGEEQVRALVWYLLRIFVAANLVLFFGLVGIGVYYYFADPSSLSWITTENFRSNPLFWAITGAFCLVQALAFFEAAYLKGRQRFRKLTLISMVSVVVQLCMVFLATWFYGIVGALLGAFFGPALLAAMALRHRPGSKNSMEALRDRVLRFTSLALAAQILSTLMTMRLEVLFLEWSWGSTAVGLFTVSLTLANMACVPIVLCTALLPHLSSLVAEDALERMTETYRYSLRLLALIVLPGCFGLAAITPVLLPAIYGSDFRDAVPSAMLLLITFSPCVTLSMVPTTFLLARDEARLVMIASAIGAALMIVSGLTLIPLFGIMGGAAGRAVVHAVVFAAALYLLATRLGCRPPTGDLIRILLAAIASGAVAFAVVSVGRGWAAIGLAVIAGVATYGVALRLFGALRRDDAERLRKSLRLFPQLLQKPGGLLIDRLARADLPIG